MKVDKAVCTSNDAYFDGTAAANELNSIIKFETVFTTLVENKILAIKRECEQHDNKKKTLTLNNLLTRKSDVSQQQESVECGDDSKKKNRKNFFLRHKNKQSSDVDVEKGERREPIEVPPKPAELVKVEVQSDKTINSQGLVTNGDKPETLDSQSNEQLATSTVTNEFEDGQQNCDKLSVKTSTEHAQIPQSTNVRSKTIKESSPPSNSNNDEDESLATTIDISLQQSSVVAQVKEVPINIEKSDIAVCDDGVSSQNTSDIEFSLVSESITELPVNFRKKTSTNSDPIVKKPALFLSPPLAREIRVSERKAISCQSTPLFGRHQKAQLKGEGEVKKVITFQTELPKKVCEPKTIEKQKSQTIVIAPTSTTTTTTLAKPVPTVSGPVETVHVSRKSQKHSKYRDVSLEYEISYDDNDGNQSQRGFISSFNQLTSQMPPVAVISTHPKNRSKAQTSKNGKNQQEAFDDKTAKHQEIELELDDLAVDEGNKKKRKRRQSSRCSDPAIYPSSSGLKHCILSRPPHQPIHIECDSGFMYDVSLQTESEFNGEIKSIVPAEHKKHRHKHQHHDHERCKERRRRRKRKILVHNLDDKSVKVIDPDSDELSKQAKFTIIATACLLLIACLLLVGITLRMAPFIDIMVREENERLMQESLNRAQMGINFTDPPTAASVTSAPSTLKLVQESFP